MCNLEIVRADISVGGAAHVSDSVHAMIVHPDGGYVLQFAQYMGRMLCSVAAFTVLVGCEDDPRSRDLNLRSDQRLVERRGSLRIEEGLAVDGVPTGTWRYFEPTTREIVEEDEYSEGKVLRSRMWVRQRAIIESEPDGTVWIGLGFENGKDGLWSCWTRDRRIDCERSGQYHDGLKIINSDGRPLNLSRDIHEK